MTPSRTPARREDDVALVTGGGRGIGETIAMALEREGYTVCVAARTETELRDVVERITDAGGTARSYPVDLGDPEGIDALLAELDRDVGAVDVLVNNAGIARGGQPLWSDDPTEWWRVLEVNLRAPMILSARLLDGMIARGSGYIINVASLAGARPTPMASAYAVSKAALARLGDSVARELTEADHGITVFTVSPGLVRTDMTAGVPAFESLPPEAWSSIEEVGELVRKLVSGEYDALSGRFVHVDFALDEMVAAVSEITEEELYVLRLPALDGLVE